MCSLPLESASAPCFLERFTGVEEPGISDSWRRTFADSTEVSARASSGSVEAKPVVAGSRCTTLTSMAHCAAVLDESGLEARGRPGLW